MFRDAVQAFAATELAPRVREMDDAAQMDPALVPMLFDTGLMGVEIGEEHGGAGATFTCSCIVIEELARVDPSVAAMVDIHNTINNNVFNMWASDRLKAKWLPRLAQDTVSSFCLSEAGSGSDAFALRTSAVRDGDDFVLNGEKMWISSAEQSGVFLVMANANPEAGYKGITCFVVPRDAPGAPTRRVRPPRLTPQRFDASAPRG